MPLTRERHIMDLLHLFKDLDARVMLACVELRNFLYFFFFILIWLTLTTCDNEQAVSRAGVDLLVSSMQSSRHI